MKDFFISYNSADKEWAEWIAWTLEEAKYSVVFQGWDFRPGSNFVLEMQKATLDCRQTLVVLSDNYLNSGFTQPEWAAAFVNDPRSNSPTLLPIRIKECQPGGLLKAIIYVDLVGLSEPDAKIALLNSLKVRGKPSQATKFPGGGPTAPADIERVAADAKAFPGASSAELSEESDPPQLGTIVSRSCDRLDQQASFEEHFQQCVRKGRLYPQMYVVHGPARERHSSLVERFRETIIQEYSDYVSAQKSLVAFWELDWSYKLDLKIAEQQLIEWLTIKAQNNNPRLRFENVSHSAATFRDSIASLTNRVVVIQHTIENEHWTPSTSQLLNSYLRFWDGVRQGDDIPQFVIFLNVVYPRINNMNLLKPWTIWSELCLRFKNARTKKVLTKLSEVSKRSPQALGEGVFCFFTALQELSCVKLSHLQTCFKKYRLGANEVAWETHSRNIFLRKNWRLTHCLNMADVEDALVDFIEVIKQNSFEGATKMRAFQ